VTLRLIVKGHRAVGRSIQQWLTEATAAHRRQTVGRVATSIRQSRGSRASPATAVSKPYADARLILAARDAEAWGLLPLASPFLGILKVIPGLYAIFQFIRAIVV